MPNRYRVSIRVENATGIASSSGYGLLDGLELKQDGQRLLQVRIFQPQRIRGDGVQVISEPVTYFDIDVEANDQGHATTNANVVANRCIALLAFTHKYSFVIIPEAGTPIYLLPDMVNLGPFSFLQTRSTLTTFEEVELTWNNLNHLEDESKKADLELALDWLHIGFVEQNDKSKFLAYWTCLELLLGPRTSSKIYYEMPEQEQKKLDDELQKILMKFSAHLDNHAQERILNNVKNAEAESPAKRWSKTIEKWGISPLGGGKIKKEIEKLYKIRNAITHSGGKKDSGILLKEGVPVESVKHIAMEYLSKVLKGDNETTEVS